MPELLDRGALALPPLVVDERAARRSLLEQIARLEGDLAALFCSAYPRKGFEWDVRSRGGPRVLSLQELETLRDDLAQRLHDNRCRLGDRAWAEQENRRRIEHMLEAPERHKWVLVSNEDIGEPGCKHWHVRPRLGLVGMLMGWWRVKISSGCPLAEPREAAIGMGRRSRKRPDPDRPTSRAERDALRSSAPRRSDGLPAAPWAPFPLTELMVLAALVLGVWGVITFDSARGRWMLFAGMVLGSLGGLEISIREHFAGRKSHTTLLAGALSVCTMIAVAAGFALAAGPSVIGYTSAVIAGALVFFAGFRLFRDTFRRRSGGLTFR